MKLAEAARYEAEQAATRREAEEERRRHQAAYLRYGISPAETGIYLPRKALSAITKLSSVGCESYSVRCCDGMQ